MIYRCSGLVVVVYYSLPSWRLAGAWLVGCILFYVFLLLCFRRLFGLVVPAVVVFIFFTLEACWGLVGGLYSVFFSMFSCCFVLEDFSVSLSLLLYLSSLLWRLAGAWLVDCILFYIFLLFCFRRLFSFVVTTVVVFIFFSLEAD